MRVEDRVKWSRHGATLAMAASAAGCVEMAALESGGIGAALLRTLGWAALVVGMFVALDRLMRRCSALLALRVVSGVALAAVAAPWLYALGASWATGRPFESMELVALASVRNLLLVFAAADRLERFDHLTGGLAVCVVAAAALTGVHAAVVAGVGVYCVTAVWWLALQYWSRLPAIARGVRPPMPWLTMTGLALAVVGLGVAVGRPADPGSASLAQIAPASGGEGAGNDAVRAGVGEGPDAAGASESAAGTGHTDEDVFAKSDLPSLIDLLTEQYGEPATPDMVERAIALRPEHKLILDRVRTDTTADPNERFSLLRRRTSPTGAARGNVGEALLYVKGPVPLYLRMAAFDRFDGLRWWPAAAPATSPGTVTFEHKPGRWMVIPSPYAVDVYTGREPHHEVRFGRMRADALPLPNHLISFNVPRVDDPGFFRCESDGRVQMIRTMPDGAVLEFVSRTCDPAALQNRRWPDAGTGEGVVYIDPQVAALAQEWAGDRPRGWDQISQVVERLRRHAAHVRADASPTAEADPVERFLAEGHDAPDYLFASAAALMLRALGYDTRLVSGLYVSEERYDWFRDRTPALAEDVHFWCEVRLADGVWITLEPTPGYEGAAPRWAWLARVLALGASIGAWFAAVWPGLLAVSVAGAAAWWWRRPVADLAVTAWWHMRSRALSADRLILATVAVVEARARLVSRPRAPGQTWRAWAGDLCAEPEASAVLHELVAEADRSAYQVCSAAPGQAPNTPLCQKAVRLLTRRRLTRQRTTRSER